MRTALTSFLLVFLVASAVGQAQKRIFLTPKSSITTSEVAEGFSKYCPNVLVTEDESRADYRLEAAETDTFADGRSHIKWHFTLMNPQGDVMMTTHPEIHFGHKFKHHFEAVCKFINK